MIIAYRQDSLTQNELASAFQAKLEVLLQSDIATLFSQVQALDASVVGGDVLELCFLHFLTQVGLVVRKVRTLTTARDEHF